MYKDINFNFKGKSVLIVGGSKGIGKELVNKFFISGAIVTYISRTKININKNIKFIKCDLSNEKELDLLQSDILKIKKIDILINAAAINFSKKNYQISLSEWKKVMSVNLNSIFFISRIVLDLMKLKKNGVIVNISSIAGRHRSIVSGSHYVASKSGLIGLTKQLAFEYSKYNIRVNVVCPSQTYTEMLSKSMSKNAIKNLAKNIPLKRIASIDEQVGPIMFLCSDASSYITGAVIDVNGGQI